MGLVWGLASLGVVCAWFRVDFFRVLSGLVYGLVSPQASILPNGKDSLQRTEGVRPKLQPFQRGTWKKQKYTKVVVRFEDA